MTTPTHLVASLALIGRNQKYRPHVKSILAGAFIPDAMIYVFFIWEGLIKGTDQRTMWDELYFSDFWQFAVDIFNSIPLILLLLLIGYGLKRIWLQAFSWSMLVHIALDLPFHNDDAHAHFLPFTNWKFESPISYWDPSYYGREFGLFELVFFAGCSVLVYKGITSPKYRKITAVLCGLWVLLSSAATAWLFSS